MHGQIGDDNSELGVISFARAERTSTSEGADQLDKAGRRSCKCCTERRVLRKKTADTHCRRLRSFRISYVPPKIGSRNSRQRSPGIRKEPSAPSSGFIASILRLKSDFFRREKAIAR